MPEIILRARWIVPVSSAPIENGRIVIVDGLIAEVGRATPLDAGATDLGEVVLMPGFTNAHTHLMLTGCAGRVPFRGSFTGWIRDLVTAHPRMVSGDAVRQAIREGLMKSTAAGVTAVADIGDGVEAVEEWAKGTLNITGFLEVLGIGPKRMGGHSKSVRDAGELLAHRFVEARAQAEACGTHAGGLFTAGISPHAPYSTDTCVYQEAVAYGPMHVNLCTHLAETREEARFLRDGTGPFRDLLEQFGLWDGSYEPPGCSPVEFAERVGLLARRPLLAHVNYSSDSDLDLLARSSASVAYCPRTHAFFQHEPHRWREMLARGINVCIGTDSLASNESLSILDELRFLHRTSPDIAPDVLLRMATLGGARALGLRFEPHIGSLEPDKRADLVAIPLTHPGARDPVEDIMAGATQPVGVFLAGRLCPADQAVPASVR